MRRLQGILLVAAVAICLRTPPPALAEPTTRADDAAGSDESHISQSPITLGEAAFHARDFAEATRHYLQAWRELSAGDAAQRSRRDIVLVPKMRELRMAFRPAMREFNGLHDQAWDRLNEPEVPTPQLLADWWALAEVKGNVEGRVMWIDAHADAPWFHDIMSERREAAEQMLLRGGFYATIAQLHPDPIADANAYAAAYRQAIDAESDPLSPMRRVLAVRYQRQVGSLYASLLAAGREEEAASVLDHVLGSEALPSPRVAIVSHAIGFGVARPEHREVLEGVGEIEGMMILPRLRRQLEEALEAQTSTDTPPGDD